MLKCPFCHFENEDGALFCEQCKSDLTSVAPAAPAPAPIPLAPEPIPMEAEPLPAEPIEILEEPAPLPAEPLPAEPLPAEPMPALALDEPASGGRRPCPAAGTCPAIGPCPRGPGS